MPLKRKTYEKENQPMASNNKNMIRIRLKAEIVTILRAVHKYKDSREQFERRTHKRLIDIMNPSKETVNALMSAEVPAGVEIEIKL